MVRRSSFQRLCIRAIQAPNQAAIESERQNVACAMRWLARSDVLEPPQERWTNSIKIANHRRWPFQ